MKKSFTLIELIVVIAIIAILAAIIAPNAFKAIEKARVAKTVADMKSIKTAFTALYTDTFRFPLGCNAFTTANPEAYLDDSQCGGCWVGLLCRPPVGDPHADTGGCYGSHSGRCIWSQINVDNWDGPYVEGGNLLDFWKTAYLFDPDYCQCLAGCVHTSNDIVTVCEAQNPSNPMLETCKTACGGGYTCSPPVIVSAGPDKLFYSCDDIMIHMTLN